MEDTEFEFRENQNRLPNGVGKYDKGEDRNWSPVKFIQEYISIGVCWVLVGNPEGKRPLDETQA